MCHDPTNSTTRQSATIAASVTAAESTASFIASLPWARAGA